MSIRSLAQQLLHQTHETGRVSLFLPMAHETVKQTSYGIENKSLSCFTGQRPNNHSLKQRASFEDKKYPAKSDVTAKWDREDWQAHYDERYGIALYEGKQSEAKAHELAWDACVIEWLNQNPVNTDSTRCAECGISNKSGATILPFGGGNHHAWLHAECWKVWQNERYKQAKEALMIIGIGQPL